MKFIVPFIFVVVVLISCSPRLLDEAEISEVASCTESVECNLSTEVLFRAINQYIIGDPAITTDVVSNVRDTIGHRVAVLPPNESEELRERWYAISDQVGEEFSRRDDVLEQLMAEAEEAYRIGVASPADALVGFWRDLSPGPPEWWAGGYYLMPNGYFVHAIFEPTPANYRGAWGQWEVAGEQLVVSFRELFFINNLDPEVPIADAGVRVEMVDDVVSVPIERLEDRRSDDPIPVAGRFPFPQSVAQTFEMDARPLVVHFRYGTHGGLWAGAPDVVPSEYSDPRELLVTVRDMDFDALQGDFIELPFAR